MPVRPAGTAPARGPFFWFSQAVERAAVSLAQSVAAYVPLEQVGDITRSPLSS
jgi:hypothetical protein